MLNDDTKLSDALAALYGISPKSHNQLAGLIKEAKAALGITSKAKLLPSETKKAIYGWHRARIKGGGNTASDAPSQPDSPVYNVKQDDEPQTGDNEINLDDFAQVHFAITVPIGNGGNKRTTVMLEGYLLKALQRKHGLSDNSDVRTWVGQAIKADGARFDSHAPLTRQVKRLIVESFV